MCTSPNRIFYTGLKTDTGADLLFFDTHYPVPDVISVDQAEKALNVRIPLNPQFVRYAPNGHAYLYRHRDVPCGKCDEDRFAKSKEWAYRVLMECQYHEHNWFLTLTFADEVLPEKVSKEDISGFMKRLRRELNCPGIKFFASGEYGEKSGRAHYHIILMGCDLKDLKSYDQSQGTFVSDVIYKCWPYGNHLLAQVTMETVCYVARYTSKKSAEKFGFLSMSNRPGLGYRYLRDHKDALDCDYLPLFVNERLVRVKPPRYAEKILTEIDWKIRKDKRVENAERRNMVERAHHHCGREKLDDYKRNVAANKARRLAKEKI